jgi:hypothetical protein
MLYDSQGEVTPNLFIFRLSGAFNVEMKRDSQKDKIFHDEHYDDSGLFRYILYYLCGSFVSLVSPCKATIVVLQLSM